MIAQFTSVLGEAKLNISGMVDQNRADLAYALIDVDGKVSDEVVAKLANAEGVINLRTISA